MDEEIIRISCPECRKKNEGTYKELFGDIPNLSVLPGLVCAQCKVDLEIEFVPEVEGE